MTGLGYREIGAHVRGEISLERAVTLLKSNTRKFIRHQSNWFRLTDPRIHWFDLSKEGYDDVRGWLAGG
jgi:tRNA dimethylallyltransferase